MRCCGVTAQNLKMHEILHEKMMFFCIWNSIHDPPDLNLSASSMRIKAFCCLKCMDLCGNLQDQIRLGSFFAEVVMTNISMSAAVISLLKQCRLQCAAVPSIVLNRKTKLYCHVFSFLSPPPASLSLSLSVSPHAGWILHNGWWCTLIMLLDNQHNKRKWTVLWSTSLGFKMQKC